MIASAAPDSLVSDKSLAAIVASGAECLGVALVKEQVSKLVSYLRLLSRWNRTYNLTAVRSLESMAVQHVVDCLAVVLPMAERGTGRRVLDVGSGGGLPGIVIAVADPGRDVVCVDAVGKKAAFITQAATVLRLRNLRAVHARVETLPAPPSFDVIASRAFTDLPAFIETTRHALAPGGWWMAMKGRFPTDEIAGAARTGVEFHVEPLHVPGLDAERHIVWARQI